ncbi:acyltransferase family protein [Methanosarcina barkeri]|uniref:acyltransferase family protein n=1 Tax=Methanosarcina barkeri TaxID=2208 RepID=UPI000AF3F46B|nr:acyltransferase [Methanosarcina barkeri]
MSSNESTIRDSNFELLRIVLISMIICLHYFKYGEALHVLTPSDSNYYFTYGLESLFIIAVDCFILITGYYQINGKFKLKKIIDLWAQVIFYSVTISSIFWFTGIEPLTVPTMLQAFLPVITGTYWFVTIYIVLYLFSPFLNTALQNMKKKNIIKKLILVSAVFFVILPSINFTYFTDTGYSVYNFVFLYCVGAYIRKYDLPVKNRTYFLLGYLMCSLLVFFGAMLLNTLPETPEYFFADPWNYNFIFVELGAICFFMVFKSIKIQSTTINFMATSVFGIYLISNHPFVLDVLYSKILHCADYSYSPLFVRHMLFSGIGVLISCLIIDFFRQKLFTLLHGFIPKSVIFSLSKVFGKIFQD